MDDVRKKAAHQAWAHLWEVFDGHAPSKQDVEAAIELFESALWQPIETAPKDGTWVILHILAHSNESHVVQAHWRNGEWRGLQDISFAAIFLSWRPDVAEPKKEPNT